MISNLCGRTCVALPFLSLHCSAMLWGPAPCCILLPVSWGFLLQTDNTRDMKLSAFDWCKLRNAWGRLLLVICLNLHVCILADSITSHKDYIHLCIKQTDLWLMHLVLQFSNWVDCKVFTTAQPTTHALHPVLRFICTIPKPALIGRLSCVAKFVLWHWVVRHL